MVGRIFCMTVDEPMREMCPPAVTTLCNPHKRNVPLCNQNDAVLVPLWTLQSVKRAYTHAHKNKLTTHRRSVGSGIVQGTASTGELRYTVLEREVPELARSTVYTLLLLLLSFFRSFIDDDYRHPQSPTAGLMWTWTSSRTKLDTSVVHYLYRYTCISYWMLIFRSYLELGVVHPKVLSFRRCVWTPFHFCCQQRGRREKEQKNEERKAKRLTLNIRVYRYELQFAAVSPLAQVPSILYLVCCSAGEKWKKRPLDDSKQNMPNPKRLTVCRRTHVYI